MQRLVSGSIALQVPLTLHTIAQFLTMKDLSIFSHCSREWYAVAANSTPRHLRLIVNGSLLRSVLASTLRRHCDFLQDGDPYDEEESSENQGSGPIWKHFSDIQQRMAWIQTLHFSVPAAHSLRIAQLLPSTLRHLHLWVTPESNDSQVVRILIETVRSMAKSAPQIETLQFISFGADDLPLPVLEQIVKSMKSVVDLRIVVNPSDVQVVTLIRKMKQLRRLILVDEYQNHWNHWNATSLKNLTAGQLSDYPQLQYLKPIRIDEAVVTSLLRLPSLTRFHRTIEPRTTSLSDPRLLISGLPQLVAIEFDRSVSLPVITSALRLYGAQFREVVLYNLNNLKSHDLAEMLPPLVNLKKLNLSRLHDLESLSFLYTLPHLGECLEILEVELASHTDSSELDHLRVLRTLRRLRLFAKFHAALPFEMFAALSPASGQYEHSVWPNIHQVYFMCTQSGQEWSYLQPDAQFRFYEEV